MIDVYGVDMVDGKPVVRYPNGGVDRSVFDGPDEHPALGRGVGADEFDEDREQAEYDLQSEIDRERYAEDAEQAERDRIRSTGPVVRGEVVNNDPPDYGRGRR